MKKLVLALTASVAAFAVTPAQAVSITNGSSGLTFDAFNSATQGTQLAFVNNTATGLTFSARVASAVYRNTLGTLDFYYQVTKTGAGTAGDDMIDALTAANFSGFTVDGFSSTADLDGTGGIFLAAFNPPASTTTTGRNTQGSVLQTDFGTNGLMTGETSAIYIFRTNAVNYGTGTYGVIDGSTISGVAFAPNAVPEPAAWAMMLGGFGLAGAAMRRRRATTRVTFA